MTDTDTAAMTAARTGIAKLATIKGYTGMSRFLVDLPREPIAWLARVQVEGIPSPYQSSPTVPVYMASRTGPVIWFETAHRRYEVFLVAPEMPMFATEAEAEEWHCSAKRARPGA